MLSANSEYFKRACSGDFQVSPIRRLIDCTFLADEVQEAKENIITLQEDDEQAVAGMIHYLYNGIYDPATCKTGSTNELRFHHWMFNIGHRYAVNGLSSFALEKLLSCMATSWHTGAFANFVEFTYDSKTLHDANRGGIIFMVKERSHDLMKDLKTYARFNEVASTKPRLLYDVFPKDLQYPTERVSLERDNDVTKDQLLNKTDEIEERINELNRNDVAFAGKRLGLMLLSAEVERESEERD